MKKDESQDGKVEEPEIKIPDQEIKLEDQPPEGFTEEEWSDLSPTEKEGILSKEEDDGKPEGAKKEELDEKTLKEIAGIETDGEDIGEPIDKPIDKLRAASGDGQPEAGLENKEIEKPLAPGDNKVSDEDLLNFRPVIDESKLTIADSVPDFIQTKLDELDAKYDEGELSHKEYNKERDALNRQLLIDNMTARNNQKAVLVWEAEQRAFLQAKPEYLGETQEGGEFKRTLESSARYGALEKTIDALNTDTTNSRLTGMQLLLKADAVVKKIFGKAGGVKPPEEKKAEKKTDEKKIEADPQKAKPAAPLPENKTLSGIPAAGANSTEDAWSQLDKLTGEAYERALEKLTPEQKEAYERRV